MNSPDSIAQQKARLRWTMLDRRDALDENVRAQFNRSITGKLLALPEYVKSKTILAYMNIGSEFDTAEFLRDVLARGKILALPKVNKVKKVLDIYLVKNPATELRDGVWGIAEPDENKCQRISIDEVDFILVPGLVFDAAGHRIGYGGGYYDKLLASRDKKILLVAAAYSMQLAISVPALPHDMKVNTVVTELSI
ncbi:MAG: 5-formyltetrahydrofolate cyclo-ligase [Burkholderiales bacterium]